MRAVFLDVAVIDDVDLVGIEDGREAVRDDESLLQNY